MTSVSEQSLPEPGTIATRSLSKPVASSSSSKPKKKRVRRAKVELDHLRVESRRLQAKLAELQADKRWSGPSEEQQQRDVRAACNGFGVGSRLLSTHLSAPREKERRLVWKEIAEQQLEEKRRAQHRNRELQEKLQAELQLGLRMTLMLHRESNASLRSSVGCPLPGGFSKCSISDGAHGAPAARADNKKKRRVRSIQAELPLCRQQVAELKLQLARCKLKRQQHTRSGGSSEVHVPAHKNGHRICEDGTLSVWNGIAERQLRERLRVEQQQQELKHSCAEAAQFSLELQKVIRKFEESKQEMVQRVRFKRQQQFWDFSQTAEDEIFSEQLATVARMRLEAQQQQGQSAARALTFGRGLSMGKDVAKPDPAVKVGVVLEARCGVLLPFALEVAVEAYWQFFRFGHLDQNSMDQAPENETDIFTRSFDLRAESEGVASQVGGSYTCRRYVESDDDGASCTLVWSGIWNIVELGGVRFRGMQLHKSGWIKLRRGRQEASTSVETYFKTTPVFHESVVDPIPQTKALISTLNSSHGSLNDNFCRAMSDLLLKEDWKSTFKTEAHSM